MISAIFATHPLNQPLVRRLVVLKLWQVRDGFDPQRFTAKLKGGTAFDWDDLAQLTRHGQPLNKETVLADCMKGYAFLSTMTEDETALAKDPHKRQRDLYASLKGSAPDLVQSG